MTVKLGELVTLDDGMIVQKIVVGDAVYLAAMQPARGMNGETVGYKLRIESPKTFPTIDAAIDGALWAIEQQPQPQGAVWRPS